MNGRRARTQQISRRRRRVCCDGRRLMVSMTMGAVAAVFVVLIPEFLVSASKIEVELTFLSSVATATRHRRQQQQQRLQFDDYSCDIFKDFTPSQNSCPTIGNGRCDDPKLGGGGNPNCLGQDCLDCNYHCQSFDADCRGCASAKGCYWCPGDAKCYNTDQYTSRNSNQSCNTPSDYMTGDDVGICESTYTDDPESTANEWMYEMINVLPVWNDLKITGKGIKIRINDDGVDATTNPDLKSRFSVEDSCSSWKPSDSTEIHGTVVAGIIAGEKDNDYCSAGIAHGSTISSCNFFDGNTPYSALSYKLESFDISSNSIGMPPCTGGKDNSNIFQLRGRSNNNNHNQDINNRKLQKCPFDPPQQAKSNGLNPCEDCDFSSNNLSMQCQSSVISFCKSFYRYDVEACRDFTDVLLGGGSCNYDKLPESAIEALGDGISRGRNGKGSIYVFASGNSYHTGDTINQSGWTNSRYTISVGSVGKDRKHADYSTPGAALMVVGPAGDGNDASNIITTGTDGTCVDSGPGTSFSAPVVSGVIALMLEARPELSWRDVQGILASTSNRVTDNLDPSATTNGAGVWHSDLYGFGIVDAKKAVDAAIDWKLWPSVERQLIVESAEENTQIPENGNEIVSEIIVTADDVKTALEDSNTGYISESVVVLISLTHNNRGDLKITLVSPSGTESVLHAGKRPENTQQELWKLMTLKTWGEDPIGTWKLKIRDLVDGNGGGGGNNGNNSLRQWTLISYGRSDDASSNDSNDNNNQPTVSPTNPPTNVPQNNPPTIAPTAVPQTTPPTNLPTNGSNPQATNAPTMSPTNAQTLRPTFNPTNAPTNPPTRKPTRGPTSNPTNNPTSGPTNAPTQRPTSSPTRQPTVGPSAAPTNRPTAGPTTTPTQRPTTLPTYSPTSGPTSAPTLLPTSSPTLTRSTTIPTSAPPPVVVTTPTTAQVPTISVPPPVQSPPTPTIAGPNNVPTAIGSPTVVLRPPSSVGVAPSSPNQLQPQLQSPPPQMIPNPAPTTGSSSGDVTPNDLILGPTPSSGSTGSRQDDLVPTSSSVLSYVSQNVQRPTAFNRLPGSF